MLNIVSLHISSGDPARLATFYRGVFQVEPDFTMEGMSGWTLGTIRFEIAAHSEVHGPNPEPARMFFDFQVSDATAEHQRLVGLGAMTVQEPYRFTDGDLELSLATLADPDGNYLQLVQGAT